MKKRTLVAMLVSAAMACTLFVGCSTPTKETPSDSGSKTESSDSKSSSSSERASATVVDADKLPIKGIGAEVSTDVKADKEYKIGYIAKNTTNPYMIAQAEGVKKAGEDMGFKAVTQAPSTADSVEEQVKIMEDMIQQDMDVIIVHCADSNGIMPGVRKAEEAGISVITIGTPASEDTFGTNIHGLGGNKEALVLAGISPVKYLIKTYAFAGFIAGIAGIITLCRVESGQPIVATGWEFQAVAATLLGGSSLREGKGGVTGTIFGVLLIQIIKNGLNVIGVQSIMQNAIIGSIVLAAIIIDAVVRIRAKE